MRPGGTSSIYPAPEWLIKKVKSETVFVIYQKLAITILKSLYLSAVEETYMCNFTFWMVYDKHNIAGDITLPKYTEKHFAGQPKPDHHLEMTNSTTQ